MAAPCRQGFPATWQFVIGAISLLLLQSIFVGAQEPEDPKDYVHVTSAVYWPDCIVGPYSWMYYPVEVPEGTVSMSITLRKVGWENPSDQRGPLVCARKGGPALPTEPMYSFELAATDASRMRPNGEGLGSCAWFKETTEVVLNSDEMIVGLWSFGFFSVVNDSRTQSQMISRGPVYKFELHIVTRGCTAGQHLGCPECNCIVTTLPPPIPSKFGPDEPPPEPTYPEPPAAPSDYESPPPEDESPPAFLTKSLDPTLHSQDPEPLINPASLHDTEAYPSQGSASSFQSFAANDDFENASEGSGPRRGLKSSSLSQTISLNGQSETEDYEWAYLHDLCFGDEEGWKFFSLEIRGLASYLEIQAHRERDYPPAKEPLDEDLIVTLLRLDAIPIGSEPYGPVPLLAPEQGVWFIAVPDIDTANLIVQGEQAAVPSIGGGAGSKNSTAGKGVNGFKRPRGGRRLKRTRNHWSQSNPNANEKARNGLKSEGPRCFQLRWRVVMCPAGRADYLCRWPILHLERIISPNITESPMDASYMPGYLQRPDYLVSAWFTFNLSAPMGATGPEHPLGRASRTRQPRQVSPLHSSASLPQPPSTQSGFEKPEFGRSWEPTSSSNDGNLKSETTEMWSYFSLIVPPGTAGSMMHVDVRPPRLTHNPLSNYSDSELLQVATAHVEVFARVGGVPTETDYDIRTSLREWPILTAPLPPLAKSEAATSQENSLSSPSISSSSPDSEASLGTFSSESDESSSSPSLSPSSPPTHMLRIGGDGDVSMELLYPTEGLWYFGVHYTTLVWLEPPSQSEGNLGSSTEEKARAESEGHESISSSNVRILSDSTDGDVDVSVFDASLATASTTTRVPRSDATSLHDRAEQTSQSSLGQVAGQVAGQMSRRGGMRTSSSGSSAERTRDLSGEKRAVTVEEVKRLLEEGQHAVEVRVIMHGCPKDCNGHGSCKGLVDGSRLSTVGYCYCDRSHGGFNCSAQLVTPFEASKHISWLVWSNLAAVLPSLWAIRHKAYGEWVIYTTSGMASALYHSCDADGWCAAEYGTLQFADFYLSFLAVAVTFLFLANLPPVPKMTCFVCFTVVDAIIARDRATSGANIYIVAVMGLVALLLAWGLEFARERQLWQSSARAEVFRPETWMEHYGEWRRWKEWLYEVWLFHARGFVRFRLPYLLGGLALLILAKLNWFYETATTYWIWHSFWHLSIYTAAYLFLLSTEDPTPPVIDTTMRATHDHPGYQDPGSPDSASAGLAGFRMGTAPLEAHKLDGGSTDGEDDRAYLTVYGEGGQEFVVEEEDGEREAAGEEGKEEDEEAPLFAGKSEKS
eukprot:TRINITY_DN15834_c0_g1_i1.p1 TRINITY_DN15834_c0_g1~~TRINITY_DN15834_c0_g1_i1.p1  ORF type:complete len:1317 (+),score=194.60 TRINITY_DN15834_c0_g1_i1:283-4233(+)